MKKGDNGVIYNINDESIFLESGSPPRRNDNLLINKDTADKGWYSHGVSNIKKGDTVILQPTVDDIIALHGGYICHEETEWVWRLFSGPSGARDWFFSNYYKYPSQLWSNIFTATFTCFRRVKYHVDWEHGNNWSYGISNGNVADPFDNEDYIQQAGNPITEVLRPVYYSEIVWPNFLTDSQPSSNPFGDDQHYWTTDDKYYNELNYYATIYKPGVVAGPGRVQLRYILQPDYWPPRNPQQQIFWRGAHGSWQVAVEVPLRSLDEGDVYYEECPI